MSLEEYIRLLIGDSQAHIIIEQEPSFRFVLPFPEEEVEDA